MANYVNHFYYSINNITQVTINELSSEISGALMVSITGDHRDKSREELVSLAMERVFKAIKPAEFTAEAADKAMEIASEAKQATEKMQLKINEAVDKARTDIQLSVDEVKAEVEKIKRHITSDDLTETEKDALVNSYPEWKPDGTYKSGDIVKFNDKLYKLLTDKKPDNKTEPDQAATYYTRYYNPAISENATTDIEVVDEWIKPQSATETYSKGSLVTFEGHTYKSKVDYNSSQPTSDDWELIK